MIAMELNAGHIDRFVTVKYYRTQESKRRTVARKQLRVLQFSSANVYSVDKVYIDFVGWVKFDSEVIVE